MLDSKALSQLSQLKSEIVASKDIAQGTVVGTNGRFGFVRTEDGRDGYLSPEKMERLLPGDIVKVNLTKNDKNKLEATLEEFVESATDQFIGTYRIKGKAHFVEPSIEGFNRWIFIPPQSRGKCKEGDLISVCLTQHPLKDGKAQVKILEKIGQPNDDKIEFKYIKAKYNLNRDFGSKEHQQVKDIEANYEKFDFDSAKDLTDELFFTIDSVNTKDMDDALCIYQKDEDGIAFRLLIAIADPTEFVVQSSSLARASQHRIQTLYMLGGYIPMLPTALSNQCFSLEQGKNKRTLVCQLDVDQSGSIINEAFFYAVINSKHKLNYESVAKFIETNALSEEESLPDTVLEALKHLHEFAKTRFEYRKANYLVGTEQLDFDHQLNTAGKIESIVPKPKNSAHRIVEEAMVAMNICAGNLLAKHNRGIASINEGFRKERLGEVKALLKEEDIHLEGNIEELQGFKELLNLIDNNTDKSYLMHPLRRMMQFARPSIEHRPHMGMGVEHYATVTSPIRRFVDLYNHWAIKKILTDCSFKNISEKHVSELYESQQTGKIAERELFQWLIIQYAEKLVGEEFLGKIRIITQQGFGVKIEANGIEGFVLFPKKTEKKYDAKRMTLGVGDTVFKLDDKVKIKIASIDSTKRRIAFELCNSPK